MGQNAKSKYMELNNPNVNANVVQEVYNNLLNKKQ
jgi:hypothetical protein